ncbi:MAG: SHOCT domain-containing protein [Rikenellaceae bacterium]
MKKIFLAILLVIWVILSMAIGLVWTVLIGVVILIIIIISIAFKEAKDNDYFANEIIASKGIKLKTKLQNQGRYYFGIEDNRIWCAIIASQKLIEEKFIDDFATTKHISCLHYLYPSYCFFVDSDSRKVAIVLFENDKINIYQIDFSSIVSIEQIKNGTTIYQKSTSGAIGRALVGGVLAGGVGAIVGGSTAKQNGKEKCTSLLTKIQLNDIANPSIEIVWYKDKQGYENIEDSDFYTQAQKTLDMFKAIIATNEAMANVVKQVDSSSNVADEIAKLHKLMIDGIITKEEFEAQKSKILNS